jgi:hypothetical protein
MRLGADLIRIVQGATANRDHGNLMVPIAAPEVGTALRAKMQIAAGAAASGYGTHLGTTFNLEIHFSNHKMYNKCAPGRALAVRTMAGMRKQRLVANNKVHGAAGTASG